MLKSRLTSALVSCWAAAAVGLAGCTATTSARTEVLSSAEVVAQQPPVEDERLALIRLPAIESTADPPQNGATLPVAESGPQGAAPPVLHLPPPESDSAVRLVQYYTPVSDERDPLPVPPGPAEVLTGESEERSARRSTADDSEPVPAPAAQLDPADLTVEFADSMPIDLTSALAMATGQNPQVAFAAQRIQEAVTQLQLSEILWVPSLRAGMNYNKHEGQIQDVVGQMIETSRGSVYTGFGAQAVGAGSPAIPGVAVNFHFRDAIFQPRIAEHVVGARMESSRATLNDTLLQTALTYLDLLEAVQVYAVATETLRNADRLAQLTGDFARTGQGLQADADRAQVELALRRIEIRRAAESVRVSSARLARLLSLQQGTVMLPEEPALAPIDLVELDAPIQELVAIGLTNRPELGESQFLVGEAVQRLQREKHAPLLPSVLMGISYGGNGGGLGSDIENFGDRLDFDAAAYWELRNLGIGERRARENATARVELARLRQVQMLDQVASEIAESHAQVTERKTQIELAELGIRSATESYRRNTERIREGEGLPIETLQAVQALDQARRQYIRAVADYNRAQFSLQRALGWPLEGVIGQ